MGWGVHQHRRLCDTQGRPGGVQRLLAAQGSQALPRPRFLQVRDTQTQIPSGAGQGWLDVRGCEHNIYWARAQDRCRALESPTSLPPAGKLLHFLPWVEYTAWAVLGACAAQAAAAGRDSQVMWACELRAYMQCCPSALCCPVLELSSRKELAQRPPSNQPTSSGKAM